MGSRDTDGLARSDAGRLPARGALRLPDLSRGLGRARAADLLAELAAAACVWGLAVLVFYSNLIVDQRQRVLAAAVINALWPVLVLAIALCTGAAVLRAARLRASSRPIGK